MIKTTDLVISWFGYWSIDNYRYITLYLEGLKRNGNVKKVFYGGSNYWEGCKNGQENE